MPPLPPFDHQCFFFFFFTSCHRPFPPLASVLRRHPILMPPPSSHPVDYAHVPGSPPMFLPPFASDASASTLPAFELPPFGDIGFHVRNSRIPSGPAQKKPSSALQERVFKKERQASAVSCSFISYRDPPFVGGSCSDPSSGARPRSVSPVLPSAANPCPARFTPFTNTSFADFLNSRTGKTSRNNFFVSSVDESQGMTCDGHVTRSRSASSLPPSPPKHERHFGHTQSCKYPSDYCSSIKEDDVASRGFSQTELLRQISALDHISDTAFSSATDVARPSSRHEQLLNDDFIQLESGMRASGKEDVTSSGRSWTITVNDLYKSSYAADLLAESDEFRFKSGEDRSAILAPNKSKGSADGFVLQKFGRFCYVSGDEQSTKQEVGTKENRSGKRLLNHGMRARKYKNRVPTVSCRTSAEEAAEMGGNVTTDRKLNRDLGMKKISARFSLNQLLSSELKGREWLSQKQRDPGKLKPIFTSQKNGADKGNADSFLRLYSRSHKEKDAVKVYPTSSNSSASMEPSSHGIIQLPDRSTVATCIPWDVGRPSVAEDTVTVPSEETLATDAGLNRCNGTKRHHAISADSRALDESELKSSHPQKLQVPPAHYNVLDTDLLHGIEDDERFTGQVPFSLKGFQDIGGESLRRKLQLSEERTAKALEEIDQRQVHPHREEQEEQKLASDVSDQKIKRWAAGKEENLRALLSNLQHVLWKDSGWTPIPLACLIEGSNVRKAYRKATLCVHPDKLQQKSATLQQKYVGERVFDVLQEAWKTFNTEELY